MAGGRAVPIVFTDSWEVNKAKLDKLNGVFFLGGDAGDEYVKFGKQIFDYIKEKNDNGTYYPQWGTCQGFQNFLMFVSSEGQKSL